MDNGRQSLRGLISVPANLHGREHDKSNKMFGRRKFISRVLAGSAGMLFSQHPVKAVRSSFGGGRQSGEGMYGLSEVLRTSTSEAISKFRKGNFRIRFIDRNGAPYQGKKIVMGLKHHDFDWGWSGGLSMQDFDPRSLKISKYFRELFNCTTAKCYWDENWHQPIEHEEGKRITDRFVNEVRWAWSNDIQCKGHPLVWTVPKAIPQWMRKYPYEVQLKKLEAHVRALIRVGHTVSRWDLCNEMLWEPSLRNLPHRHWPHIESIEEILTYLEPAVHWAREENPEPVYSLNDYGLVRSGVPTIITASEQRKRYLELIEEMDKRNCAPDAIGSQCHVAGWYSAQEFQNHLDDLAKAGLPIQVTEFFINPDKIPDQVTADQPEEAFIDNVIMIYTLAFAHPMVSHFTYWGGRFFDEEGNPTRLYNAIYGLVKNKWMTEGSKVTDENGEIRLNAFYGTYVFHFQDENGNTFSIRGELLKQKKEITLKLG